MNERTLYYHFRSKDDLVAAPLSERIFARLLGSRNGQAKSLQKLQTARLEHNRASTLRLNIADIRIHRDMFGNRTRLTNCLARFRLAIFRPAATENARQQHGNAAAILLVGRAELSDQVANGYI